MKKMSVYNLTNERGDVVKKLGFACPDCKKVYSELRMRYEKKSITCTCGTKLKNPMWEVAYESDEDR